MTYNKTLDLPIDIFPLCEVESIEKKAANENDPDYKYKIRYKDHRSGPSNSIKIISAKTVILAAGSLGSTEILLRSKNKLSLSPKLGMQFSTNGDLLGVISPTKETVDASRGPITTSIARFKNKNTNRFSFSIEDEGIPKMFAELFAKLFNIILKEKESNSIFPKHNLVYKKKRINVIYFMYIIGYNSLFSCIMIRHLRIIILLSS